MTLQKRERILVIATVTVVLLYFGATRVRDMVFGPVIQARERLDVLREQSAEKAESFDQITQAAVDLQAWRDRSLPADPFDAHRLYQAWLTELGDTSGLRDMKVVPGTVSPRGQVYVAVPVTVTAKADYQALGRFLYRFERTDLAHRIVSITIRPQANTGDPDFDLNLLAEGLAFVGAKNRSTLFPETELKTEFTSKPEKQTIEVADAAAFPQSPGFRVAVGDEILKVAGVSKNHWDVIGGVDKTSAAAHKAGDVVRLAPVQADYADRTLESIPALAQSSLFIKPTRAGETPRDRERPRQTTTEDVAADTHLSMFYVFENDKPRATLIDTKRATKTDIAEGTEIKIGDIEATVVEIHRTHVVLKNAGGYWRLAFGDTLRKMAKIDPPPQTETPQDPEASKENSPSTSTGLSRESQFRG